MKQAHIKTALKRMGRSRFFVLFASLGFGLLVIMGTTFAWLVSSDTKTNEMGIMQYQFDVGLVEDLPAVPAVKGGTIQNEVHVENTGDIPEFIRVMVFPTLVAADGVTLMEMQIGEQVTLGTLGASWIDGEDGYFYYLGRLGPGDATADPLFEEVILDANIAGNQADAKLNIAVVVESIDGTGSYYRSAWWGADIVPAITSPFVPVDTALQFILGGI